MPTTLARRLIRSGLRSRLAALGVALLPASLGCGGSESPAPPTESRARDAAEPPTPPAESRAQGVAAEAPGPIAATPPPGPAPTATTAAAPAPPAIDPPNANAKAITPAPTVHAYVVHDGTLRTLARTGRTTKVIDAPGATLCDVDGHHGVVWIVGRDRLDAFDPADGTLHRVAEGFSLDAERSWQVVTGPGDARLQTAGAADGIESCLALTLSIDPKASIHPEIIGDGDRLYYCLKDDWDGIDLGHLREVDLNEDTARAYRRYKPARLVEPAYLTTLARRRTSKGAPRRAPLTAPAPPKVAIDEARCPEAAACGQARYVGGERLWMIVTGDARGDFYYEYEELYDATTKSFWDPSADRRRTTPLAEPRVHPPLHVSPDGTWGIVGETVVSMTDAKVVAPLSGTMCGWQ